MTVSQKSKNIAQVQCQIGGCVSTAHTNSSLRSDTREVTTNPWGKPH